MGQRLGAWRLSETGLGGSGGGVRRDNPVNLPQRRGQQSLADRLCCLRGSRVSVRPCAGQTAGAWIWRKWWFRTCTCCCLIGDLLCRQLVSEAGVRREIWTGNDTFGSHRGVVLLKATGPGEVSPWEDAGRAGKACEDRVGLQRSEVEEMRGHQRALGGVAAEAGQDFGSGVWGGGRHFQGGASEQL